MASQSSTFEFVVVGSGAGGGTVAARLVERGFRVLLLEAGGDPMDQPAVPSASAQSTAACSDERPISADYSVPVFHGFAAENQAISWDFFVRHYQNTSQQQKDEKYTETYNGQHVDGVLYPRAGTLGGCTSHHAQITVYPHNDDWNQIASLVDDPTWSATRMRRYFERIECCAYRPWWKPLAMLGINPTRHGFFGWLQTEVALPFKALAADNALLKTLAELLEEAFKRNPQPFERLKWGVTGQGDPNDWRLVNDNAIGLHYTPLATRNHARHGIRERLLELAARHPERFRIELNALVTRVLLDDDLNAIGVEYRKGASLYKAHRHRSSGPGETQQVFVSREVILAGGAFNTPQLLMLSGIGPAAELQRHQIDVKVDLPGVGGNLQDRYEVCVVNRMKADWEVLKGATFSVNDPQYQEWRDKRDGVYTTNGAVLGVIKRSQEDQRLPDLFLFALIGCFKGYFPGYSRLLSEHQNYLSWAVLKAHTQNNAGTVRLRSADPLDTPVINFNYFEEGSDHSGDDLKSVVEGVKFVRSLSQELVANGTIEAEELPGPTVQSDAEIAEFVRANAWGHHASCSCPIGRRENGGVVNGDFEVFGVRRLRIVDASVFPRIPGFFIVTAIYMIAEKAADVISSKARLQPR